MGSERETADGNLPIYVSVGENLQEGKSMLTWALHNFEGAAICLLHVHHPPKFASLLKGKLSRSKNQATKACQESEQLKMQKLMNQYLLFLSQMGKPADKVCLETRNIEKGILQLISQHKIRMLIMGAGGAETFTKKKSSGANSSKVMVVCQQAPSSCHIWVISKGNLAYERPAGFGSHSVTALPLSPSTNGVRTVLTSDLKGSMDVDAELTNDFRNSPRWVEEVMSGVNPNSSTTDQRSQDSSPVYANIVLPEHIASSSSNTSLDSEFAEKESLHICDKLEHSMMDSENSKKRDFEESLRCRAEEDAVEALHKAEAAENLFKEETNRSKEIEEQLLKQRQELETMKHQRDKCLKELQLIQDQKPALESQLREAHCSEKELEDKIIQAVNLLITFKGTRDQLQMEYDHAARKINKYRALQTDGPLGISHFFGISFSDIIEATQNFNPSHKIGEGRCGSVFKGMLCHVKVAIKMLPSSGSQSDSEFKNEMEVISRVRHPNLVTLIGACPESRSLIYEYIGNGSLEDYLSTPVKTSSLPWQTRMRIAVDMCSALMFLHASNGCNVHGNLKPSNVLLDSNFAAKISDFGILNLVSQKENDPENLAYVDPEFLENGELTTESDVYSFGVLLLRLLTGRAASGVIRDVKCALQREKLESVLDMSAGDWAVEQAKKLCCLGLRCCERDPVDRPELSSQVWTLLKAMAESRSVSASTDTQRKTIPSHFVCPILQEVMKDPHIAGDGFTYEGEAIKGWFNSGHSTSPMTNLKLDNCDLLPNYALYYAIQEWLLL